jgi:hypothetical protein
MSRYVGRALSLLYPIWQLLRTAFLALALVAVLASVANDLSTSGSIEFDPGVRTLNEISAPDSEIVPPPPREPDPAVALSNVFGTMSLEVWNERYGVWQARGLAMVEAALSSDGAVPLLLRIDDAKPGTVYAITIMYNACDTGGSAGFDSLSGVDPSSGILPPAPAAAHPDSTIPVPESHAADAGGHFALWGATFQDSHDESSDAATCDGPRAVMLTVLAGGETVFLMWAGHVRTPDAATCLAITADVVPIGSQTLSALDCPGTEPE